MRAFAKAASAPSTNRENATFSLGVFAAMLVCAAAFLGIGASAAGAATPGQSYGYREDVGTGGAFLIDQFFRGVAVSADDGRIFLAHQANGDFSSSFEVLEPDGTPLTQATTPTFTQGIAVSPDGSAVYTLGSFSNPSKMISDGAPTPTYSEDPLWNPPNITPSDIGIDPTTGDVLVANQGSVVRLDPVTGEELSTVDGVGARRLSAAASGDIYALDNAENRVKHLASDGSLLGELELLAINGVWADPGIAVNPQNGDVAVLVRPGVLRGPDGVIRIYTAADDVKEDIRVPASLTGSASLAFSADGSKLYVGTVSGTAHVFALGTQPGLDGPTTSALTATGVHLSDSLATGGKPTKAHFEYCLASKPCSDYLSSEGESPWKALSDHESDGPFADDLTGLQPLTDYLVRSYAVNTEENVERVSAPVSVSTPLAPPDAQTGGATADQQSATLTGTVNSFGGQTTYRFEYGLTTGYGSRVPAGTDAITGNQRAPRPVSQTIKGLQAGATYHYRLVATNAAGTTFGDDRTFTTLATDEAAPQRAYEQVTSPDKKGLSLNGNFGFQASPDGGAIEYSATAPSADSSSAPQASRYIARRGDTNWNGQVPLDPPLIPTSEILNSATHAVSGDFEHAMVVTPIALTPDAVQGRANIYVTDIATGAYHLVGTATDPAAYLGMDGTKRADVFIGGARDFSWVVLISRYPLLPDAPQVAMYKWSETGGLSIVSRLPDGSLPTANTWSQSSELTTNRLVSDDGETFAFTLKEVGNAGAVYRRSEGQTEEISVSRVSGDPSGAQPGIATGMSRDGRYVVFISHSKLTEDATDLNGLTPWNVYRYDAQTGELAYLGESDGTDDGSTDLLAMSDDGGTVYFNRPREATDGNGEPITIHELSVWRNGQAHQVIPGPVRDGLAYASPNGRYIVALLGGTVYLYDAETDERTCLSCALAGDGSGGQLPNAERNISNEHPQVVTDDGHAYFTTAQPLLSSDHNSANDVYEYFRGRTTLLSPGNSDLGATLLDISADGRDVYFVTAQGLVGQDTDDAYDIYDARLGGGLAAQNPPPPSPPCAGDACQGAPGAPPAAPTPGSAQLQANGDPHTNKTRCPKNTRKVRRNGKTRCVRKHGKPHSKKRTTTNNNRGAGR